MFKTSALADRPTAERLSDLLSDMDPSPASAVSTEEYSRQLWRLDAFCEDMERAEASRSIIELEAPDLQVGIEELPDKDWVAESLKGLPAVKAGPYVVAGAHELAKVNGGVIPIWIEAGPAFGTGHHGTTMGCLEALARLARRKSLGRVLDLGTGSGVLAIAAVKSGADLVIGTDIDEQSVRIARENARNNAMPRRLKLRHANGARGQLTQSAAPYDVVMANILSKPLISLADDVAAVLKPGGHVILSGLLNHQRPLVTQAYKGRGLNLVETRRIGAWSTLVFQRPAPKSAPVRVRKDQCEARRASRLARRLRMCGRLATA